MERGERPQGSSTQASVEASRPSKKFHHTGRGERFHRTGYGESFQYTESGESFQQNYFRWKIEENPTQKSYLWKEKWGESFFLINGLENPLIQTPKKIHFQTPKKGFDMNDIYKEYQWYSTYQKTRIVKYLLSMMAMRFNPLSFLNSFRVSEIGESKYQIYIIKFDQISFDFQLWKSVKLVKEQHGISWDCFQVQLVDGGNQSQSIVFFSWRLWISIHS